MRVSAQAPRFFEIYDSQFPLASSRFGRDSTAQSSYRVGKTHCQGHQDPSKRVPIFLRTPEANVKMVPINSVAIPRNRTVLAPARASPGQADAAQEEEEEEEEEEGLLTNNEWMSVGRHNALSRSAAAGRTGQA